jgi:hypothetical protein
MGTPESNSYLRGGIMAKENHFSNFDSPYETQPPKGSAEGPINYGGVAEADDHADPLGVLPREAKQRNIGPASKE